MTIQWPKEKETEASYPEKKIEEHLETLLSNPSPKWNKTFDELVQSIAEKDCEHEELVSTIKISFGSGDLKHLPDYEELVLSWACSKVLAENPTLETWKKVRHLKNNSCYLARWLVVSMLIYAKKHPKSKQVYIDLAKKGLFSLDNLTLESDFSRINEDRKQHSIAWKDNSDKLTSLWQGLHWRSSDVFTEENTFFILLQYLHPIKLFEIASKLHNPYLIDTILWVTDAGTNYELWRKAVSSTSKAFGENGSWNEQILIPLLLKQASKKISKATLVLSYNSMKEDKQTVREGIENLAGAVISTLSSRDDFLPLTGRWSSWLMRQLLMQGFKEVENIRSSAVMDMALLDAIGEKLKKSEAFPVETPADASFWEAWCRRITLAYLAYNGFVDSPDFSEFLSEWPTGIDEWKEVKAKTLRERVSFLSIRSDKRIPGDAASYLAYSAAKSSSPTKLWEKWWDNLFCLREIVEFGDPDSNKSNNYDSQSDAASSLFLSFCVGLSLLDQVSSEVSPDKETTSEDVKHLFFSLYSAVKEMCEIDVFLTRGSWKTAFLHLAARRLIWEKSSKSKDSDLQLFKPEDAPSFPDILYYVSSDEQELISILLSLLLNNVTEDVIKEKLFDAKIDLNDILDTVKKLNDIDAQKYPMNKTDLEKLKPLCNS